jgi:hypothetical protein
MLTNEDGMKDTKVWQAIDAMFHVQDIFHLEYSK